MKILSRYIARSFLKYWLLGLLALVLLFIISIIVNIGMWLERFVIVVTSLAHDFLPSAWGIYHPPRWDWAVFLGTLGFFAFAFLLFIRVLPMISVFEMKHLLPEAHPHVSAPPEEALS